MGEPARAFAAGIDAKALRALADRLLETYRVEYVEEGVLLVMTPAGFSHRKIIERIVLSIHRASILSEEAPEWTVHTENFQWNLPDDPNRFYVPDVVVVHPQAAISPEHEREGIVLIVEVTSPISRDTELNDRDIKPEQYAKDGVPYYLLVDQEVARWTLYGLAEGWSRYQIVNAGKYGAEIPLPDPLGFSIPTGEWPPYKP